MLSRELAWRVHPSAGWGDDSELTADLITEAHAVGLVSDREVREDQVHIRTHPSRHTDSRTDPSTDSPADPSRCALSAVIVRGRVIGYAKRAAPDHPSAARLAHEKTTMTQLSALDLVPQVHGHQATLWTSALPGSRLDRQAGTMPDLADTAQAWGLALARLHTERVIRPRTAARRPWVLAAEARPPRTPGRQSPAASQVLRMAACDAALRRAARQAGDRWSESGWIHGDLTARHVIVDGGSDIRVRLVDVSTAGAGDPSWDVASALETLAALAPVWQVSERVLSDYLLRGYRRGGGPGRLDPEFRAVRAVEIAWQIAAQSPESAGAPAEAVRWLDRARSFAGVSGHVSRAA